MVKRLLHAISPQLFLLVLSLVFSLNLIDGLLTLIWVSTGIAEEANPIMAAWLEIGPLYFLSVKLTLVTGLLFFIHRFYSNLLARGLVLLVFLAYLMVLFIHLDILYWIVTHAP